MSKTTNNYLLQAEHAARMEAVAAITDNLEELVYEPGDLCFLRFRESEGAPDIRLLKAARIMRVETGHVLVNLGDNERRWFDKADFARRYYEAMFSIRCGPAGFNPMSVPRET